MDKAFRFMFQFFCNDGVTYLFLMTPSSLSFFEVQNLGFRFEIQNLGFRFEVQGLGFRFEVQGLGFS